jgi:hypothetical protein
MTERTIVRAFGIGRKGTGRKLTVLEVVRDAIAAHAVACTAAVGAVAPGSVVILLAFHAFLDLFDRCLAGVQPILYWSYGGVGILSQPDELSCTDGDVAMGRTHDTGPIPSNLHLGGMFNGRNRLPERVEQKYFVAPARLSNALAVLQSICRWDDEYPQEWINSLYFDTVDLDQHERSTEGEYAKDKVRIRWYGRSPCPHEGAAAQELSPDCPVPIWLELKSRRGFASTKQRVVMQTRADSLTLPQLPEGIVSSSLLGQTMAYFGFHAPSRLVPIVAISYWRYRFVEPRTGYRVALDSRIRSSLTRHDIGLGEQGLELAGGIIEVKGPSMDFPAVLRRIADLGMSWTRYSKYSSSLDAHVERPGTQSRLWPSGTLKIQSCIQSSVNNREV